MCCCCLPQIGAYTQIYILAHYSCSEMSPQGSLFLDRNLGVLRKVHQNLVLWSAPLVLFLGDMIDRLAVLSLWTWVKKVLKGFCLQNSFLPDREMFFPIINSHCDAAFRETICGQISDIQPELGAQTVATIFDLDWGMIIYFIAYFSK